MCAGEGTTTGTVSVAGGQHLGGRDVAALDELSHENLRAYTRLGEVSSRIYGFGEFGAYFADVDEIWDDVRQTATDIESLDEARVVLTVRYQARAKSSGLEVDQLLGVIVRLHDRKVERVHAYPSRQMAIEAAHSAE